MNHYVANVKNVASKEMFIIQVTYSSFLCMVLQTAMLGTFPERLVLIHNFHTLINE